MIICNTIVTFSPEHEVKHDKQGWKLNAFRYLASLDPKCCVLEYVKNYIRPKNKMVAEN